MSSTDPVKRHAEQKRYREANKEKIAAKKKETRDKNKDEINEQKRQYRKDNLEKVREQEKKNDDKHRDAVRARVNAYDRSHPKTEAQKMKRSENAKKHYQENKEKILAQQKEYAKTHKEEMAEYQKTWRKNNKEHLNELKKNWYHTKVKEDPEFRKVLSDRAKKRRQRIKQEIMSHYGNECQCCHEKRIEFLSIDHVNNDGNKHRIELFGGKGGGYLFYTWLMKNNYPQKEFRCLCLNCNMGRQLSEDGLCPHERERLAKGSA